MPLFRYWVKKRLCRVSASSNFPLAGRLSYSALRVVQWGENLQNGERGLLRIIFYTKVKNHVVLEVGLSLNRQFEVNETGDLSSYICFVLFHNNLNGAGHIAAIFQYLFTRVLLRCRGRGQYRIKEAGINHYLRSTSHRRYRPAFTRRQHTV